MYLLESVFAAIIPMLLYLYIIWKNDKFEPEPGKLVFKSFLYGALGAVAITLVGSTVLSGIFSIFLSAEKLDLISTVLIAPVVEEIAKALFLFTLVKNINFDNITDGLVYGGAIGLGFGMTENFMYFFAQDTSLYSWVMVVIIRSLFSAVMHCISTATVGAFLAIQKFSLNGNKKYFHYIGFFIAMFIHFLWNFNLSFDNTVILAFLIMFAIIISFVLIFKVSLKNEQKLILKELSEEEANGIIPDGHSVLISSPRKVKIENVPDELTNEYISSAIKLAFRKTQFRKSLDSQKDFYGSEIDKFRNKIIEILN